MLLLGKGNQARLHTCVFDFLPTLCCVLCFPSVFLQVDYPLAWVESHARGISEQVDRLARVLDVCTERFEEGANFRSSLLKKEPLLQYVATNLHIQVREGW